MSADDHRDALAIADVLESQAALNQSVARALQAVALTADRHDAEMAELRDEIDQLGARINALKAWAELANLYGIHNARHAAIPSGGREP